MTDTSRLQWRSDHVQQDVRHLSILYAIYESKQLWHRKVSQAESTIIQMTSSLLVSEVCCFYKPPPDFCAR